LGGANVALPSRFTTQRLSSTLLIVTSPLEFAHFVSSPRVVGDGDDDQQDDQQDGRMAAVVIGRGGQRDGQRGEG
jgi:hypothetical protein